MPDAETRRSQVASGITWTVFSQALDLVLSFGSMLVLVRILAPAEYGRAAAVVGILAFVNTFSCPTFLSHSVQLPDDETPDWQSHWTVTIYLQSLLFLVCHLLAWICWYVPQYRPIAPLLHVAAFGVLIDGPNQIGSAMLRRELDFRRLRVLAMASTALKLGSTVTIALAGGGAMAIVIGGNVMTAFPYATHLLIVRGWRPSPGWWRLPSFDQYRASAHFGFRQIAMGLVSAASGAFEAAVLPGAIGFTAIGLLGRARALYTTTAGRLGTVLLEAVYPFLPREAADSTRYARHATTFLQVVLFVSIPGGVFLGLEGPSISRLLYGQKWIAMDPLIWPGALSGIAMTAFITTAGIVLAAGRLRAASVLDIAIAILSTAALTVAWSSHNVQSYAWSLTIVEISAAVVALWTVSAMMAPGWLQRAVLAPIVVAVLAAAAVLVADPMVEPFPIVARVGGAAALFSLVACVTCRFAFRASFSSLVRLAFGSRPAPVWLAGEPASTA
jgi:PST family polysaccharide transporter